MFAQISDSNKPIFEVLNNFYTATRSGRSPFTKGKTLRETLENMKLVDIVSEEDKKSGINFTEIKASLEDERPHLQEDFKIPDVEAPILDDDSDLEE